MKTTQRNTIIALIGLALVLIITACPSGVSSSPEPNLNQDEQLVANTVKMLSIQFSKDGDTLDRVTSNFKIIGGSNLVTVNMDSSNNEVVSFTDMDATVKRPTENVEVTLTATVSKGYVTKNKTFKVTVYGTDTEKVDASLQATTVDKQIVQGGGEATVKLNTGDTTNKTTTTWGAEPAGIVNTATGEVTKPEKKTVVTLTAKVTKGNVSKTKIFTVTVYPDGAIASLEDILKTLDIPATTDHNIELPTKLTGVDEVKIEWSVVKGKGIDKTGAVSHDFIETQTTLRAKATNVGDSETKEFTVTVPAVTTIGNSQSGWTFEGNTITYIFVGNVQKWSYSKKDYKITALKTHITNEQTNVLDTVENAYRSYLEEGKTYYKNIEDAVTPFANKETLNVQDFKALATFINQMEGLPAIETDEDIYNRITTSNMITHNLENNPTWAEFSKKNLEDKSTVLKGIRTQIKKLLVQNSYMQIDASLSFKEIFTEVQKQLEHEFNYILTRDTTNHTYTYTIANDSEGFAKSFVAIAEYKTSTSWQNQHGNWKTTDNNVVFEYMKNLKVGSDYYSCIVNETFTEFSGSTKNGKNITATITDNKNGTITVDVKDGETYTLNFEGSSLEL